MFRGWAILPATQVLFNKNKVTLKEIATHWPEGTVMVMEKPNGRPHFIAGAQGDYAKVGTWHDCYHDQTGAQMGCWKVLEQIRYKTVDGQVYFTCSQPDSIAPLQLKAPVAVFK